MERIPFDEVVANTYLAIEDGIFVSCVTGEDGVWNLITWPLLDISWVGTTSQLENERTLWILKNNWEGNVGIVEELVIVLEVKGGFGKYENEYISIGSICYLNLN